MALAEDGQVGPQVRSRRAPPVDAPSRQPAEVGADGRLVRAPGVRRRIARGEGPEESRERWIGRGRGRRGRPEPRSRVGGRLDRTRSLRHPAEPLFIRLGGRGYGGSRRPAGRPSSCRGRPFDRRLRPSSWPAPLHGVLVVGCRAPGHVPGGRARRGSAGHPDTAGPGRSRRARRRSSSRRRGRSPRHPCAPAGHPRGRGSRPAARGWS